MPNLLFILFAAITLGFGVMVLVARNPVTSALSLAMSFVGLAALFIGLDAYFLGVTQVLVYAGAVMVLFLFIIMLLDIRSEEKRKVNGPVVVGGLLVAVVLVLQAASVTATLKAPQTELPKLNLETAAARADVSQVVGIQADLKEGTLPDAKLMGLTLFDRYGFHLQVIALLLVVGTVGVVALSKKDKGPAA